MDRSPAAQKHKEGHVQKGALDQMDTYCGKSCEFCSEKKSGSCPGCRVGPGRSLYSGCEIAGCCRSKGHESCETCTMKFGCGKRGRREGMPKERRRKAAEEEARRAEIARKAPFLGRWLWVLFWFVLQRHLLQFRKGITSEQEQKCELHKSVSIELSFCVFVYFLMVK